MYIYRLELQIVSEMLRVNTGCSCYCQHNNAPHWAGSSGTMSLYQGWIYLQEHRDKVDLLQRESDLQWMRSTVRSAKSEHITTLNHKSMFMVTPLDIRVLKIIVTNKNRNNRDLCQE